ncbi:hypothetical protein Poli38472_000379 [Pythium oligandrum]|uniref:Condensin complex subunit 1 C-terminal domain-containing protein n=1 Tax=Pythium oligandrum TaxID=41045 RepID=A0A8K1CBU6_PYTOL|nr:hypothetical protein Poli38472_000379 [Pythium oligandrum]|eukprot:TMW60337.1 hypothetical protein Poli38472_000379 [Pythium oligandrum]
MVTKRQLARNNTSMATLEKELVRALRALALQDVPDAAIKAVFDTGGTVLNSRREDAEFVENATLEELEEVDRVFHKYVKQFVGTQAAIDQRQDHHQHSSTLWTFLSGDAANTKIMGEEDERAHPYAAYRALFTLLHALISVGERYPSLKRDQKIDALNKALLASKTYLNWLQLPGGSAYGLFMPFVYRQVLDVIKKWADLATSTESAASVSGASQNDKTPRKRGSRKGNQVNRVGDEGDGYKQLVKLGADMLDTMVMFLQNFTLSSSKESIVPTVETVVYIQIVGCGAVDDIVVHATTQSQRIFEALLTGQHGEIIQIARVVIHCYIPGASFQDMAANETGRSLQFHKLAIEIIGMVQTKAIRSVTTGEDQDEDSVEQLSGLFLGLVQNISLRAPDRAEERQRVLNYVLQACLAPEFLEQDKICLARFLASYSKSAKAKFRQFAVELVGKLILEPSTWKVASSVPEEMESYVGVAPLLEILSERSNDKVSAVRAKAISAISAVLTAGLKSDSPSTEKNKQSEEEVATPDPNLISASLGELLYTLSEETGKVQETPLMLRLVELFREGIQDEKTYVRKAAVQALEALIVVRPGNAVHSMRHDVFDMQARCGDPSVIVRVQSVKSLSSVLLKFPEDEDVQRLWNLGVLPLCVDAETSVQSTTLEHVRTAIFDRISKWYYMRDNKDEHEKLSSVWVLVSHIQGVMVRCVQKGLRLLLKDGQVRPKTLIKACILAIRTSLANLEKDPDSDARFWGFSWIILEELARSGLLVEAAESEAHNLGIVVDCWNKVLEEELPDSFAEGSKRTLRVIAALSPVIDAQDAKAMADSILGNLHSFTIPIDMIPDAILALSSICKAKAPTLKKGREISFGWGKQLLDICENSLRTCFESEPEMVVDDPMLIQKQLICIGEIALLEFIKDEEKNREAGIKLLSIATARPLVQLFLPPSLVPNGALSSQAGEDGDSSPVARPKSVLIPIPVRVCAFVTFGKMCLRDQDLAKSCITMLIRELRTCKSADIRSNILVILGDLCIRYTALVDPYVPTIALSFTDESPLIRRNALLLFSQLILQDYIKWRESLLRFFLRAAVDSDEELSNLARHVLCGPLLQKSPHLFTNKFIEMIFVFNKNTSKLTIAERHEREGVEEIALPGQAKFHKRSQLYKFLLQNMTDEQKLQISMKLCTEVLEEVSDGKLKLCKNPSEITDFGTEAVLKDTFAILCSPDIKLSSGKDEGDEDGEDAAEATEGASVANQLAAAKGKLLSKMSKKNFLENIVPVLIGLKHKLEANRSPLMRYLLHYIRELFKLYGKEVQDILSADPQMAMEVEYDLRQFELQQKQQEPGRGGGNTTPTKTGQGGGQRTPLEELDPNRTPQLLPEGRARRRQSMPTAGTPAHPVRERAISSDEKNKRDSVATTLFFSPNKGSEQGKWQVKGSRSNYTQEALEENMQRTLVSAFDETSPPSSPVAKPHETQENDDTGSEYEEFVRLPLKKKQKQKSKKKTTKKKDASPPPASSDPLDMATPKVNRAKRKRN